MNINTPLNLPLKMTQDKQNGKQNIEMKIMQFECLYWITYVIQYIDAVNNLHFESVIDVWLKSIKKTADF